MAGFKVAFMAIASLVYFTGAKGEPGKVLCEGDNMSNYVYCKEDHVIQIENAKFGRDKKIMCQPRVANASRTRSCGTKDVYDIVSPVCEGKERCDNFVVNTRNFGGIEGCENVITYLFMRIECIKTEEERTPREPRPEVKTEERSKKKTETIMKSNEKATSHVQFSVDYRAASTSTQPLAFFILIVGILSIYCS